MQLDVFKGYINKTRFVELDENLNFVALSSEKGQLTHINFDKE